jgi:hypothetical protein
LNRSVTGYFGIVYPAASGAAVNYDVTVSGYVDSSSPISSPSGRGQIGSSIKFNGDGVPASQDSGVDGDAQRISQLCWMFFLKIIDDQDQQIELMQGGYRSPIPKQLRWRSWASDPEGITGDELLTFVNTELFPKLKVLSVAGEKNDRRRVVRDVF